MVADIQEILGLFAHFMDTYQHLACAFGHV